MTLSSTAIAALAAQQTSEVLVLLLTIDHADLAAPIRVCEWEVDEDSGTSVLTGEAAKGIVSRGNFFQRYPFELVLPSDKGDEPPSARVRICNVGRELVAGIRSISSPPTFTAEVVLMSTPNVLERGPIEMSLKAVDLDMLTVEGTLSAEDFLTEPYPGHTFSPSTAPGVF